MTPASPVQRAVVRVVRAEDRQPLEGAQVTTVDAAGVTRSYATDVHGGFEPQWDEQVTLWARAPDRAVRRWTDVPAVDNERVLELRAGAPITLRFVGPDGSPIATAEARRRYASAGLRAACEIAADTEAGGVAGLVTSLFGPSGAWRRAFDWTWRENGAELSVRLGSSGWRIFVQRPGAEPFVSKPLESADGEPLVVDVPLPSASLRRVRFVAADSGALLDGASVRPYAELGDDAAFFAGDARVADAHGEIGLPLCDAGRGDFDRPPTWWVTTPERAASFRMRAGDEVLEVRVPRRGSVTGMAFAEDGTRPRDTRSPSRRARDSSCAHASGSAARSPSTACPPGPEVSSCSSAVTGRSDRR